jgi:hypothetical protein
MICKGTVARSQSARATTFGALHSFNSRRSFISLRPSISLRSFISRGIVVSFLSLGLVSSAAWLFAPFLQPAFAAEDLTLRKGISFDQDTDTQFPIICKKTEDTAIEAGKPTMIFFGAAGDLNTNRQAKKVVSLYQKFRSKKLKFIVVDVDHPANDNAKTLIKKFYKGYIPCQTILDKNGNMSWRSDGEVSEKQVSSKLDEQLKTI